jgi:hypothetical protein
MRPRGQRRRSAAALEQFLGTSAGFSGPVITRLTAQWRDEARAFAARDLSGVDYVCVWAEGIVRHEALYHRVEVEDLHRWAVVAARVEAEGSLTRETTGRAGSGPDNAGTCWHCQTVRSGKPDGKAYVRNQRLEPLNRPSSSNLADLGWVAGRTVWLEPGGNSEPGRIPSGGRPR